MSTIQEWVMQLCIVCILVSVILAFVKNEKINNSIKTVLALYILLTAVLPIANNNLNIDNITVNPPQSVATVDANIAIKQNAQQLLIENINESLQGSDIFAECISVELNKDLTDIEIVVLNVHSLTNEAAAIELTRKIVGENAEVIAEKEG